MCYLSDVFRCELGNVVSEFVGLLGNISHFSSIQAGSTQVNNYFAPINVQFPDAPTKRSYQQPRHRRH